ncbi:MAG: LysR substrate-binding domain-containing protein [Burkholderiaceae bacterium]
MNEHLDTELLQTLLAIADTGSFAGAAQSVHRTQSAVSMQMKRLEELVGQPLFEKQGRRAVITVQGENLLLYARRILALQSEAIASFRSPAIQGEVKLGVCDDYVMSFMPAVLAGYAQAHPHVHISLDSQTSDRLIRATTRGALDIALVNVSSPEISCEQLRHEPMVWVSSANHLTHEASVVPLAIENSCLWGKWAQQALDKADIRYRLAYSTFNLGGMLAIVEAGLAVSILTRTSVPPHLRILTEQEGFPPLPSTSIGLVTNGKPLSPAALALAQCIRAGLSETAIAA